MTKSIRILFYSDIHWHSYTNGLRLADFSGAIDQIISTIRKTDIDIIIFGGDEFTSRNPLTEVRLASDISLKKLSDLNKPIIRLVGNHCRVTKNKDSNYSTSHIKLYPRDLSNMDVADKPTVIKKVLSSDVTICLHCTPAGYQPLPFEFKKDTDFTLYLFHDTVVGSKYVNHVLADKGIDPIAIDNPNFDLVLGGDNHQPQYLNLKNTVGIYAGSLTQLDWGDVGSDRGYWIIELIKNNDGSIERKFNFIKSKSPQFVKEEIRIESDKNLIDLVSYVKDRWSDNIVKLTLVGPSSVLHSIHIPTWQEILLKKIGCRWLKISTIHEEQVTTIKKVTKTASEEWLTFIEDQKIKLGDIDISKVAQMGLDYIDD